MSTQLRFDPNDDDMRHTAYELMGEALGPGPKTGSDSVALA